VVLFPFRRYDVLPASLGQTFLCPKSTGFSSHSKSKYSFVFSQSFAVSPPVSRCHGLKNSIYKRKKRILTLWIVYCVFLKFFSLWLSLWLFHYFAFELSFLLLKSLFFLRPLTVILISTTLLFNAILIISIIISVPIYAIRIYNLLYKIVVHPKIQIY